MFFHGVCVCVVEWFRISLIVIFSVCLSVRIGIYVCVCVCVCVCDNVVWNLLVII